MAKKQKPTIIADTPEIKKKDNSFLKIAMYNVVLGFIVFVFLFQIFHKVTGYQWLYFQMLKENNKAMKERASSTFEERHTFKLGGEMDLLFKIKKEVPSDAIVIMPSAKVMEEMKATRMGNSAFAYYFTFPVRLTYEDNKETDPLYKEATYVFCVGQYGLEKTADTLDVKNPFRVLPIKK